MTFSNSAEQARSCARQQRASWPSLRKAEHRLAGPRIGIVNRAINLAIRPMSDLGQWGVIDRWSAPLDTLTTGFGDCEDYAIAKYVALTQAGVAAEDVRLVIVHDLAIGEDHAVVAARFDGDWIILDNRRLMLVKDSDMRRTVPLFVLDQTGVRQFAYAATPDASALCKDASCVPASWRGYWPVSGFSGQI